MGYLILYGFYALTIWLLKRDVALRPSVSKAIWIPTLWVAIIASRPISSWIGAGGAVDTTEGSPLDRMFFFVMIIAALIVLSPRRVPWSNVIAQAWPIFAYYLFFLISVLWAESPLISFKRWFKDFGNILIAMVILTEKDPALAFRAVFVRCAYFMLPLSVIYLRWFPDQGRRYSMHSGMMEVTGVTTQKNTLGALVLVCGIALVWEWLETSKEDRKNMSRFDRWKIPALLLMGVYLLYMCDSQTSLMCLTLASAILFTSRIPIFRKRIGAMGLYALIGAVAFVSLDNVFELKKMVVEDMMGRDMTFTGRTDVWEALFAVQTDPLIGTGFCSFWDNDFYQSKLPEWVAFSAHNGYIEMYLDGGMIGVAVLGLMLAGVALILNKRLSGGGMYPLLRFAVLVATIIGNLSESHYGRMSPLWFMFLFSAMDPPATASRAEFAVEHSDDPNFTLDDPNLSFRR